MIDVMHGPQFAKQYVTDYLSIDIPVRLIDYRNAWNLDDSALPSPIKYLTYEPIALDEWPTIITVAISTNGMEREDFLNGNPIYRVTYSMRTYVWVRTEGSEETTFMRDRLTTVIRSALLDYPCLKAQDYSSFFQVQIDEGSLREEYSDLTLLKGDRVLAGAYLAYNLTLREIVMREPIGEVSEIEIETEVVGMTTDWPED